MGTTIKQTIGLVAYGIICFVASLVFVQCSERSAQKSIQEATLRAESAEATILVLQDENGRLRETMIKANAAVEQALTKILEAQERHEERMDIIEHDPDSADWLSCDLPDSVRDVFKEYYSSKNRSN